MSNGSDRYTRILRQYWGHSAFRGIQRDIIESIGSGHDTLGLMPTGGGKSITFQVPALAAEGVCIVITPLIALMKDQVYNLRRRGILAAAIYSGMTRHEILRTLENCILGSTKVLYVSPERITSELFKTKLRHMKVSFITVDEAHCISQWGYDFRPSYLHIADIRQIKPEAPLLALTATATRQVAEDIQEKLKFKDGNMFRMSFERKNLAYIVRHATDKRGEMLHILRSVRGSAIVYVRSRKRASEISGWLEENGVTVCHIDNPLVMDDFESNARFVEKTEKDMLTLRGFYSDMKGYSRMIDITEALSRRHMLWAVKSWHNVFGQAERRLLTGKKAHLRIYDAYKLGFFATCGAG